MLPNENSSNKPVAVITGASSGIGYELAKQFAMNGFDLIIAAEDAGIEKAAEDFEALNAHVRHMQVNLAHLEGVQKFYNYIKSDFRNIDALVLNAGVGVSGDFSNDTNFQEELNVINLNIVSVVLLTKLVVKDMLAAGHGRILFTSSVASLTPGPFMAIYSASKAFVQSFALAIREELRDQGITVTSLMPDATETNFFKRAHMEDTKAGQAEKDDPAVVAKQGFEALMEGKDHVIGGSILNKIQAAITRIMPQETAAKGYRKQTEPGSAKH